MEQESNTQQIKMYVVTNVTKINRKIYSIFRVNIGRALPLRSILYFIITLGIIFLLRHIPLLNYLFLWIPVTIAYIGIPIGSAYLLGDIASEDRTPYALFRSVFQYHMRQQKNLNFYRGKVVPKPVLYKFKGMPTYRARQEKKEVFKREGFQLKGFPTYKK